MRILSATLLFAGLWLGVNTPARASDLPSTLITDPGPGFLAMASGNNTLGYDFTVGSAPVTLTELGLFDATGGGFADSHRVGLWDGSGNLLASVFLPSGTGATLIGQFRYEPLSVPVTLQAGTVYLLGAGFNGQDGDQVVANINGNQAAFDPSVTSGDLRFSLNSGFAFPNYDTAVGSEVGPNAVLAPVPEPATVGLLLLGGLCLCGWRLGRVYIRRSVF